MSHGPILNTSQWRFIAASMSRTTIATCMAEPSSNFRTSPSPSELVGFECVTSGWITRTHPRLEPTLTLFRGSMGKRFRHAIALRAPLQAVVANLRCRVKRLIDVPLLEDILAVIGALCPHTGETVGLQFH